MIINVRLSRSVTHTAHHISRAPQAVLIVLSRWRMDKGARDPTKPPKGTHVKDCTDWWPNFVDSSWQCLFVETRANPIICYIYTLRHYGPRKSNWTTKMVRIRQIRFGPLAHLHPRIPGQDCSSTSLFSTSMDAAVHVHVKAWGTPTWTKQVNQMSW